MMGSLRGLLVVVAGSAANLLFAAMFVARVRAPHHAHRIGLVGTGMAAPLAMAAVLAWTSGTELWDIVLPLVFVVFAAVELVVDEVLDFEVRASRWLWPYLLLFYVAQWAVIGAAFRASEPGGFAVLVSYFVCLFSTVYSYRRVGHGATASNQTRRASSVP
jgi:hypothetical protein